MTKERFNYIVNSYSADCLAGEFMRELGNEIEHLVRKLIHAESVLHQIQTVSNVIEAQELAKQYFNE